MNTTATRMMLALSCGLLWAGPAMSANEMRFSDLEARMAAVEQKTSAFPGLKSAAFLSDGDPIDAVAPNDAGRAHADEELSSPSISHGTTNSSGTSCGSTCECGAACGYSEGECCQCPKCCDQQNNSSYYAEIDVMFLRTHMLEDVAGKLSEKYELSPRFIVGYETAGGVGARVRYWTYGRTTPTLNTADEIRFEFNVLDFEATSRFQSKRSELVVAGGFRFAGIESTWDEETVKLDAPGITLAADLRTLLCGECGREWAAVVGGRWSVLGGDWEGSDDGFVAPFRDDNLVVQELYAGAEYSQHYANAVFFTRLVFEMQNWHSDVMSQTGGVDSISLLGPGIHVGAAF